MVIKEALNRATSSLKEIGVETPRLDAEVLLSSLIKKDRVFLYTYPDFDLDIKTLSLFEKMIAQRAKRKPVAYIIGKREFMGLDFFVDENVLIPRPDTEILVETILKKIKKNDSGLDLATGSGAIGLSLKHYRPDVRICLSDISSNALRVAKRNAFHLGLKVDLIESDLFEKINRKFDFIVSNPPYIASKEIETLSSEIKDWEPRRALDGGQDGYHFYRLIVSQARAYLNDGGRLYLESGDGQSRGLIELFNEYGYEDIKTCEDFSSNIRVVSGC